MQSRDIDKLVTRKKSSAKILFYLIYQLFFEALTKQMKTSLKMLSEKNEMTLNIIGISNIKEYFYNNR